MQRRTKAPRSVAFEAAENISTNMSANPTLGDVIAERLSRRDLVQGLLAVSAVSTALSPMASLAPGTAHADISNTTPAFNFKEVAAGADDKHYVAEGYDADILIRWGDPVLPGAPAFDPHQLTPAGQAKQFGYNNDYLAYFALPGTAAPSEHGLLCVNHEYTNEELMFPGLGRQDARRGGPVAFAKMTQAIAEVEMMAHGGSVLEIKRTHGKWAVVANSNYARRITAGTEVAHLRSRRRTRSAEDGRGPDRQPRPRHAQQLCRRSHALGNLAVLRGKHQRLLQRRPGREPSRAQKPQANGDCEPLVQLGRLLRSLQHRQGAQRSQPFRLDRGDRSLRPNVDAR